MKRRFLRFLIVGGVAALVNVVSRYLLSFWLPYSGAILIAFCCGLTTAFLLSRSYVFPASNRSPAGQATWFLIVNLLALAQVWAVSVGLAEWLFPAVGIERFRYDLAHVIGVLTPAVTSYFAHKHVTFKEFREAER